MAAEPTGFSDFVTADLLGEGGMGRVYKARQISLDRWVALKVLPAAKDKKFADRFVREARSAARLVHPNIVQIYTVGEAKGIPYYSMEYIEGEDLENILRVTSESLSQDEIIEIIRCVTKALALAMEHAIVHRDIKPANIMVTRTGLIKVMDFGLAKGLGADQGLTQAGLVVGTPTYMSPEQGASRNVDSRSDLYSLGCVLYYCLTGQPPFVADNVASLLYKHMFEMPDKPGSVKPGTSPALEDICMKMLQKKPEERFQSPMDVLEALAQIQCNPTIAELALAKRATKAWQSRKGTGPRQKTDLMEGAVPEAPPKIMFAPRPAQAAPAPAPAASTPVGPQQPPTPVKATPLVSRPTPATPMPSPVPETTAPLAAERPDSKPIIDSLPHNPTPPPLPSPEVSAAMTQMRPATKFLGEESSEPAPSAADESADSNEAQAAEAAEPVADVESAALPEEPAAAPSSSGSREAPRGISGLANTFPTQELQAVQVPASFSLPPAPAVPPPPIPAVPPPPFAGGPRTPSSSGSGIRLQSNLGSGIVPPLSDSGIRKAPTKVDDNFVKLPDNRWSYRVDMGACRFAEGIANTFHSVPPLDAEKLGDCLLCSNWNKRCGCTIAATQEMEYVRRYKGLKLATEQSLIWVGAQRYDRAIAVWEAFTKANPDAPEGYRELARVYDWPEYNGKDKRRAVVLYRRFAELARLSGTASQVEIARAEERAAAMMGGIVETKSSLITPSIGVAFHSFYRGAIVCFGYGVMTPDRLIFVRAGEVDPESGIVAADMGGAYGRATTIFRRFKSESAKKEEQNQVRKELGRLSSLALEELAQDPGRVLILPLEQVTGVDVTTDTVVNIRNVKIRSQQIHELLFPEPAFFKADQCYELLRRRLSTKPV